MNRLAFASSVFFSPRNRQIARSVKWFCSSSPPSSSARGAWDLDEPSKTRYRSYDQRDYSAQRRDEPRRESPRRGRYSHHRGSDESSRGYTQGGASGRYTQNESFPGRRNGGKKQYPSDRTRESLVRPDDIAAWKGRPRRSFDGRTQRGSDKYKSDRGERRGNHRERHEEDFRRGAQENWGNGGSSDFEKRGKRFDDNKRDSYGRWQKGKARKGVEHYDEIGNRASVEWEADDIHNKRYGDWEANVKAESSVISMALAAEDDDLLYGVTPVLRALESMRRGRFVQLFAQERGRCGTNGPARKADNDAAVERIMRIVTSRGIEVQRVSKGDLNVLSHNRPHQGLVLQAGKLDYIELKKMRDVQPDARNEKGGVPCYLVLDEVSDPQNVGALLRSALFLGADGVIVCKRNSCGLTAVVSKASAGALEVMDVHGVASMPRFLKAAGESGWRIVGMGLGERAMGCKTVALERPTLVVVGNEGKGLRPLVRDKCDVIVRIEGGGDGEVDSLNVSVAGAVALYQLLSGVEELSVALDGVKSSVSGVEGVDGRAVEE